MKYVLAAGVSLSTLALSACENTAMASVHYVSHSAHASDGYYELDQDEDASLMGSDLNVNGRVGGDLSLMGSDIDVDATVGDELAIVGSDIRFEGRVGNDASIAGSDVDWRGDAGGDIDIAGSDVNWSGSAENLDIAGSDISIDGTIRRDLNVAGSDIDLSDNSNVARDANFAGSDIMINGAIGGALDVAATFIEINGGVQGAVRLHADPEQRRSWSRDYNHGRVNINGELTSGGAICARLVVFGSRAEIGETLTVYADEPLAENPTNVTFEDRDGRDCEDILDMYEF